MADSGKLPKELAEQIQTIAGSVYVQVEEELTALLAAQAPPKIKIEDISPEQLARHAEYQALESQLSALREQNQTLQTRYEELADSDRQALLDKDREQEKAQLVLKEQKALLGKLELSESKLNKENAAKAATLDVQNKQISSLQQELNETASELERVKSDARQASEAVGEELQAEQQRIVGLQQHNKQLNEQLNQAQAQLEQAGSEAGQELESVRKQAAELKQANDQLNQQLAQVKNELEQVLTSAGQAQVSAKEQMQSLEQTVEQLTIRNTELTGGVKQKQDELEKLHSTLVNKASVIKQLTAETDALQAEKAQQEQAAAEALKEAKQGEQALQKSLGEAEARLLSGRDEIARLQEKQQSEQESWQTQLTEAQTGHRASTEKLKLSEQQVAGLERQCAELEQQASVLSNHLQKAEQRLEKHREKFQADGDKARETIKYLRDENFELNARLESELSELESKLTEYRLRFEYAQKQLEKN